MLSIIHFVSVHAYIIICDFQKRLNSSPKFPFSLVSFSSSKQLKPGLPSSVTLQPAQGETDKPCGVDFILRCFVAKNSEDKIEKRNSVRLAIKKITHAPVEHTQRVRPSRYDYKIELKIAMS